MYHTEKINARVSAQLKTHAEAIFEQIGISSAEAIRIFYAQVCLNRGLPFAVKIPNKETEKALHEAKKGKGLIESKR